MINENDGDEGAERRLITYSNNHYQPLPYDDGLLQLDDASNRKNQPYASS
ncbi:hypothetical protein ACLK2I_13790 [Escherichia coli]